MVASCELHVLQQIYDFLSVREEFNKKSPHGQVLEFFRELNMGNSTDFVVMSPTLLYGKFGRVTQIKLLNVPIFRDKDKFIKWAFAQLN